MLTSHNERAPDEKLTQIMDKSVTKYTILVKTGYWEIVLIEVGFGTFNSLDMLNDSQPMTVQAR